MISTLGWIHRTGQEHRTNKKQLGFNLGQKTVGQRKQGRQALCIDSRTLFSEVLMHKFHIHYPFPTASGNFQILNVSSCDSQPFVLPDTVNSIDSYLFTLWISLTIDFKDVIPWRGCSWGGGCIWGDKLNAYKRQVESPHEGVGSTIMR